jgi:hypothetical protein
VLAKRDTWEGNVQRFVDHLVPPLVTNSSGDNNGRFDCIYYLLYTHVHTYKPIMLCFWLWRPFLLACKLRLLFPLSAFIIGLPVLLLDPRRIHLSSADSYVM